MKQDVYKVLTQSPGLKGREIANKLELKRKDVNSFLDKNKESFYQDEEYRWFNRDNGETIELQVGWVDADCPALP